MANFAKINEQNIVEQVIVIDNGHEENGQDYINNELDLEGRWIQTSYNNNIRKQFAGPGYYYNEVKDIFIGIKPFESWILNENNDWVAPIPEPEHDRLDFHWWDEENLTWTNKEK